MSAPPSGGGADRKEHRDTADPISSRSVANCPTFFFERYANGAPCPVERHWPIPHDKIVLWPSSRRPLQRDLDQLVARWEGWR
jgi:hypothetical protein